MLVNATLQRQEKNIFCFIFAFLLDVLHIIVLLCYINGKPTHALTVHEISGTTERLKDPLKTTERPMKDNKTYKSLTNDFDKFRRVRHLEPLKTY